MQKSGSNTNLSRLTAGSTAWASMEKVVRGEAMRKQRRGSNARLLRPV